MTRQSRKKVTCYNFTINRVHEHRHLLSVASLMRDYSNFFAVGLETKANIGSDHIQGFIKLNSGTTFSEFRKNLKSFLKESIPYACFYAVPVPREEDSEKCIRYACKENVYYVKRGEYSTFSKDLTESSKNIIMLLEKNNEQIRT